MFLVVALELQLERLAVVAIADVSASVVSALGEGLLHALIRGEGFASVSPSGCKPMKKSCSLRMVRRLLFLPHPPTYLVLPQ